MNRKFIAKELLLLAKSIVSSFDNIKRFQNGLVNYAEKMAFKRFNLMVTVGLMSMKLMTFSTEKKEK